ncbi:MAG: hypothetical protein ABJO36_11685 [Litorimonas sp.]
MDETTQKSIRSSFYLAILLLGALLIGATLGAITINKVLYSETEEPAKVISPPRTGMQILDDYQCMKAESKKLILRGVEDNYDSNSDETIVFSDLHEYMRNRNGKKSAVTVNRSYDEGGMDKFLLDEMPIPSRTVHGLFLVKARSLTRTTNDSINIGEMATYPQKRNNYGTGFASISQADIWRIEGGTYSAQFSDLVLKDNLNEVGEKLPRDYDTILDFIQSQPEPTAQLGIYIGDDHAVDFIGAAICLPPEKETGISFLVTPFPGTEDIAKLSCLTDTQVDHCDPYKGDTLCSTPLPLACFDYTGDPAPDQIIKTNREKLWAKGSVKFTPAVTGETFKHQGEVHAFCAANFGSAYRAATHQENLSGQLSYIARGSAAVTQAWVHAKTEPYGNCWALETEYDTDE